MIVHVNVSVVYSSGIDFTLGRITEPPDKYAEVKIEWMDVNDRELDLFYKWITANLSNIVSEHFNFTHCCTKHVTSELLFIVNKPTDKDLAFLYNLHTFNMNKLQPNPNPHCFVCFKRLNVVLPNVISYPERGGEISFSFGYGSRYDLVGLKSSDPSKLDHSQRVALASKKVAVICDQCFEDRISLVEGYEQDESGRWYRTV